MKPSPWVLVLYVAAILILSPIHALAQYTGERWSVKIGTDPDAGLVNLNSPTPTTLSFLTSLAPPNSLPDNNRVQPTETTLRVVNATLNSIRNNRIRITISY